MYLQYPLCQVHQRLEVPKTCSKLVGLLCGGGDGMRKLKMRMGYSYKGMILGDELSLPWLLGQLN